MAHGTGDESHLKKGLRQRHLAMIAIGGVIGAGLFVGSGAIIGEVGPAAFLTYALTGVLIVMVMRMRRDGRGEPIHRIIRGLRAAGPRRMGRVQRRRLYWYFWVIVVGFEAVAGAGILQRWLPDVPLWVMALG
jgi:GABA permease